MVAPLLLLAGGSAVMSAISGMRSNTAARRAQRAQRDQQNLRNIMERRQQIRATRMAMATAEQTSENQGVSYSSGAQGGQGSIQTQGNVNLNFLSGSSAAANKAGFYQDKAASYAGQSSLWGSISQLAQAGMSLPGPSPTAAIPGVGSNMTDAAKAGIFRPITSPMGEGFAYKGSYDALFFNKLPSSIPSPKY